MKIIIMGAGKVGELLCRDLSEENHEITLIELDETKFQSILNRYDINGIIGNGASSQIQEEAGVSSADLFISATENDELNMIAAVIAKKSGAKRTVARVRNTDYADLSDIMRISLGITLIINPESLAAKYCSQLIEFPLADSFESFIGNRAPIVELKVDPEFNLVGRTLADFRNTYRNLIVCCVLNGQEAMIPKGDHKIEAGSHLFVTGNMDDLLSLYKHNGQENSKIKSLFIIGGGLISEYIIRYFEKRDVKIKLVELNPKKAEYLSKKYPDVEVVESDGTAMSVLKEQRAANYDALLALTGIDEENIIITMVAKKLGVKKTLTKISRTELIGVLDSLDLQSVITPKRIASDTILQYVRALDNSKGSNVEALYKIANDKAEALSFKVNAGSCCLGVPLKDMKLKNNIIIAYLFRGGQIIFPTGNDCLMENDRVVVISNEGHLRDLDEIVQ